MHSRRLQNAVQTFQSHVRYPNICCSDYKLPLLLLTAQDSAVQWLVYDVGLLKSLKVLSEVTVTMLSLNHSEPKRFTFYYHPRMRRGHVYGRVCQSVMF